MKIAIAYNRSGKKLAEVLIDDIKQMGHELIDLGTDTDEDEGDCPDGTYRAANVMLKRGLDRLILIYGTGLAASISANKIKGLYAAPCWDVFEARIARQLYNTNVLCLSERWLDLPAARAIAKEWLETSFHDNVRRNRALRKIHAIEEGQNPALVETATTSATPG